MGSGSLDAEISTILAAAREKLRVSRARCYAMAPTGDYRLAASYGFASRFAPEDVLSSSHPLVDWVQKHRKPMYVNSPSEAGLLADSMQRDHYARMLAAPVYLGSRLVGIVELQDRLGGGYFAADDLHEAEGLASRVAEVVRAHDGTSVAAPEPMAQEDADALFRPGGEEPLGDGDFPEPPNLFSAPPPRPASGDADLPGGSRGSGPAVRPPRRPVRREELVFRGFWTTLLLVPEVEAVAFSTWTREAADIQIGARRPFSDRARSALLESAEAVLATAMPGTRPPSDRRFANEYPLGRGSGEVDGFAGIQTSVLLAGSRVILLSILFSQAPSGAAEEAFREAHRLIRASVLQSATAERYRNSFRSLVRVFIEPGLRAYPQLKAHSLAVAALCRRFATSLRMAPDAVEQLAVAGLLHDIGIREVEVPYERLAGRRPLDLQEVALVRRHAPIGADILERIDFPYPVATLVRHHHERFDGAGYPDGLSGDRIPLGSRIIGIAEAYDAMTASHSYRATITPESALEVIAAKSGTQFDPELAKRFREIIRTQPLDGAGGSGLS
ncbi:MAG: HD domain-containing phosphohydrolase [Acidobacteriota bacterium]